MVICSVFAEVGFCNPVHELYAQLWRQPAELAGRLSFWHVQTLDVQPAWGPQACTSILSVSTDAIWCLLQATRHPLKSFRTGLIDLLPEDVQTAIKGGSLVQIRALASRCLPAYMVGSAWYMLPALGVGTRAVRTQCTSVKRKSAMA